MGCRSRPACIRPPRPAPTPAPRTAPQARGLLELRLLVDGQAPARPARSSSPSTPSTSNRLGDMLAELRGLRRRRHRGRRRVHLHRRGAAAPDSAPSTVRVFFALDDIDTGTHDLPRTGPRQRHHPGRQWLGLGGRVGRPRRRQRRGGPAGEELRHLAVSPPEPRCRSPTDRSLLSLRSGPWPPGGADRCAREAATRRREGRRGGGAPPRVAPPVYDGGAPHRPRGHSTPTPHHPGAPYIAPALRHARAGGRGLRSWSARRMARAPGATTPRTRARATASGASTSRGTPPSSSCTARGRAPGRARRGTATASTGTRAATPPQEPAREASRPRPCAAADDSGQARCYETSEPRLYNHSRAVARLLINGTSACTGWLVGNQGHLLTNNHCIRSATDAHNTTYELMAEGATCADELLARGAPARARWWPPAPRW